MIVSSSNNKHWLIPKGIVEPGMTAEESACKEAFEEAGVKGIVEDFIGSYAQKKWGAKCTVAVYAMRVTEILPVYRARLGKPALPVPFSQELIGSTLAAFAP